MLKSVTAIRLAAAAALGLAASICLAAAPAAGSQQATPDYTLNTGDQLEISVWKEPDLTKTAIVRPDGKFSFPLAGEVVAAGRTVTQIQTEIASRITKYMPEPVVTASVTGLDGNRIYVIGQVNKPGAYGINPRLNVLQALAVAGGMTAFASTNDIIILRRTGAQQRALQFHYGEVSKGRNLEQNVSLEAGDVVVVP